LPFVFHAFVVVKVFLAISQALMMLLVEVLTGLKVLREPM
jgi:hypothetical protein